jgi:hypothetical protein
VQKTSSEVFGNHLVPFAGPGSNETDSASPAIPLFFPGRMLRMVILTILHLAKFAATIRLILKTSDLDPVL